MDDCNPNDIFANADPEKSKDIFDYFEKQSNNQQRNSNNGPSESER
jgi:hypothetical protein